MFILRFTSDGARSNIRMFNTVTLMKPDKATLMHKLCDMYLVTLETGRVKCVSVFHDFMMTCFMVRCYVMMVEVEQFNIEQH